MAELLLMDDDEGVTAARAKGLTVTGRLGVLSRAAQRHLLDLADAFDRVMCGDPRFSAHALASLFGTTFGKG